jgi:hypothetical protein
MAESMEGVVTTDAEQPVENPAEKTITGKLLFHPWSTWSSLNAFYTLYFLTWSSDVSGLSSSNQPYVY